MTEQRAIELLEYIRETGNGESSYIGCGQGVALNMAIKALDKDHDCIIKHLVNECSYSETGCSDCKGKLKIKNALEKQIAKKPIDKLMYIECPACGDVGIEDCAYCPVCGQKLDWSEV